MTAELAGQRPLLIAHLYIEKGFDWQATGHGYHHLHNE
jgi:hypothetical protein